MATVCRSEPKTSSLGHRTSNKANKEPFKWWNSASKASSWCFHKETTSYYRFVIVIISCKTGSYNTCSRSTTVGTSNSREMSSTNGGTKTRTCTVSELEHSRDVTLADNANIWGDHRLRHICKLTQDRRWTRNASKSTFYGSEVYGCYLQNFHTNIMVSNIWNIIFSGK